MCSPSRVSLPKWDGGKRGVELYDHVADPHEYRDLAAAPEYAAVAKDLRAPVRRNCPADSYSNSLASRRTGRRRP
jgi:hypothetical protein